MRKILYIEDDPSLRQLVDFILQPREQIRLIEADTGKSGLQAAVEHSPDIILLDLSLPDMSGFEVLKELQYSDATNNIPVIAVSGDSLPEDIKKGLEAGLFGYLTKPIMVTDFNTLLDSALQSST